MLLERTLESLEETAVEIRRILREQIVWKKGDIGRFTGAVHLEAGFYYATPDGGVWCNGLDGVGADLDRIFAVDETACAAIERVFRFWAEPEAKYLSVFQWCEAPDGAEVLSREVIRLAVFPDADSIGPVIYQCDDVDFDVDAWARSQCDIPETPRC